MEDLPAEIFTQIAENLEIYPMAQLRAVNQRGFNIAQSVLSRRKRLNVWRETREYREKETPLDLSRLCSFLRLSMPQLTHISFRRCPVEINLGNLIQLASSLPSLSGLDLSREGDWPRVERDAVYALPYFTKLTSLQLNGWRPSETVRRGCVHRVDTLPIRHLRQLEHFEMDAERDALTQLLLAMSESGVDFERLKKVRLGVRHTSTDSFQLLLWFLETHKRLEEVHIADALFATEDQVRTFYGKLSQLPSLHRLTLSRCESCDRLNPLLLKQFSRQMVERGVSISGCVRSMRFDPDAIEEVEEEREGRRGRVEVN